MNVRRTLMKRFALMAAIALTLLSTGQAQAAIFEPQHDWWNSGRSCVDSRNPPGLAWDDPAPRACVSRPEPARSPALGSALSPALDKARVDGLGEGGRLWLARAEAALAGKVAAKI